MAGELQDECSYRIIGACIEVHRELGPGLLESVYEECLAREFSLRNITFARQVIVPLEYKGERLPFDYRLDLVVEGSVIVELKSVEKLTPLHSAQLITYLRLTGLRVGLLVNFHEAVLRQGLKRLTNWPTLE